ncbi:MAG: M28 family peptidase [Aristaeellaceae bacterium]
MTILEVMLGRYPVRKTAMQKQAFRQYALEKAKEAGYKAHVESNGRFVKHHNVVIGDPEHAAVIFSAHYDTPAVHMLPSLLIPRNAAVFYAWQLLAVVILLLISAAVTTVVSLIIAQPAAVLWIFVACYMGLLMLLNYGPANRQNANSSTSGVTALLQTMAAIPEDKRGKVAFILFDDSAKGKQGSRAYAKEHLQVQCVKTVVNLDCVGVGEDVLVIGKKMARLRPEYARLCAAMQAGEGRSVHVLEGGLTTYTADHDSFQCGVAVLTCKRGAGVGWYVPHLNTAKDTVCHQDNLDFLTERLIALTDTL